jgi:Domain of unknown function (DUF4160)
VVERGGLENCVHVFVPSMPLWKHSNERLASMPRVSSFYGMTIAMYYREHGVPHFHVRYAEHDASLAIETLELLEGSLPKRALALAHEWAELHRNELMENWQRARNKEPLLDIDPLP